MAKTRSKKPSKAETKASLLRWPSVPEQLVAVIVLAAGALFAVWVRTSTMRLGHEIVKLDVAQQEKKSKQHKLTRRVAELRDPARLEQAAAELGLAAPAPHQVVRLRTEVAEGSE